MPFNADAFFNNPLFQAGSSIIGNTGIPGVVGNAFTNMARINQLKQEAASQQQQTQIARDALTETSRYHTGELGMQQQQFGRQNALTDIELRQKARQMALQQALIQALAPKLGVQIPSNVFNPPQDSMPPQQGMPQQAPMQQQGGMGVPDASQIMHPMSMMTNGLGRGSVAPEGMPQRPPLSPEEAQMMQQQGIMQPMSAQMTGQGAGPAQQMQNPSPLQQYGMDAMQQNVPKPPQTTFNGQTYNGMAPNGVPGSRMLGGAYMQGLPQQANPPEQVPSQNDQPLGPASGERPGAFGAPDMQNNIPMMKTGGKFGTPDSILNGIRQVESSGNPNAINPKSGAMGAYQFMPGTVDQMRRIFGQNFDPFDPAQARDAADYLMQQRLRAHGGDLRGALADYGGFVTKDPSSYIHNVARAGMNLPLMNVSAHGGQQPQQDNGGDSGGSGNPGLDLAQAGALMGLAGMPGSQALVNVGQMMEPKNVPGNSYQRDAKGNMTYVPDPVRNQELEMQARRLANENAKMPGELKQQEIGLAEGMQNLQKGQSVLTNEQIARNKDYSGDQDTLYKTTNWATNLKNNIDQMVQFDDKGNIKGMDPAFNQMTGATGMLLRHIPGTPAYDMHEKLESLLNQTKFEVVNQMKNQAGQTGLGRVLQSEFQAMGESLAPIDPNMSTEGLAKSLFKLRQEADKLTNHAQNGFTQRYGSLPPSPDTNLPQAATGSRPAGVYAPPQSSAFNPQDIQQASKVINGVTYVKTGPGQWERQ